MIAPDDHDFNQNPTITSTEIVMSPIGRMPIRLAKNIHRRLGEMIRESEAMAAQEKLDKNQFKFQFTDDVQVSK